MTNIRLQLLKDLVSCNMPMIYWLYDEDGNVLEQSDDMRQFHSIFRTIFIYSRCFETMRKHFGKKDCPLVLSIGIGLTWAMAVERIKDAEHFHIIGPAFLNAISHADVLRNIKPLEDRGVLDVKHKRQFLDSIYSLPVTTFTMMAQYAIWLHFCINEEKLTAADVATERSSHLPEHATRPALDADLHRIHMVEQTLMEKVRNGDLDYKKIWAKAIQMEVFEKSFADSSVESKKISCIEFTKLCAHYAALGGLSPAVSYSLELSYVKAIQAANRVSALQTLQNDILDAFIHHVHQHKVALDECVSPEIQTAREYVVQHITEDLSLEDIAAQAGYSSYYFSRKFKREIGMSVNQYIKVQKIEYSKFLLATTDLAIQEITDWLSLCSSTYFSSAFHSVVGCSPTEYRRGRAVSEERCPSGIFSQNQ